LAGGLVRAVTFRSFSSTATIFMERSVMSEPTTRGFTATELAQALGMELTAVTNAQETLVCAGMIVDSGQTRDGETVWYVTELGRKLMAAGLSKQTVEDYLRDADESS